MQIEIEDYLAPQEIKDACLYEIKQAVKEQCRTREALEELLFSLSVDYVEHLVNDTWNDDLRHELENNIHKRITELSRSDIFYRGNFYHVEDSVGQKYLDEAIKGSKELINERLKQIVDEELEDIVKDVIREKFYGEDKG